MDKQLGRMSIALLLYDLILMFLVLITAPLCLIITDWLTGGQSIEGIGETAGGLLALFIGLIFIVSYAHKWIPGEIGQKSTRPMKWQVILFSILLIWGIQLVFYALSTAGESIINLFGFIMEGAIESAGGENEPMIMVIYSVIMGPIAEEVVFRGAVMRTLQKYGKWFAIVASAIFFGVYHSNLPQGIYAFFMGVFFAWIAMEYSIYWSILLHIFNNAQSEILNYIIDTMGMAWVDTATNVIFFIALIIAVFILFRKRKLLRQYHLDYPTEGGAWRSCFSRTAVILFIMFNILLAILEITPISS